MKEIVSHKKVPFKKASIIFQKGIQLSSWGDWSTCSKSCGGGEMIRSRSCLTGCEPSSDDLTQTDTCNEHDCKLYLKNHL